MEAMEETQDQVMESPKKIPVVVTGANGWGGPGPMEYSGSQDYENCLYDSESQSLPKRRKLDNHQDLRTPIPGETESSGWEANSNASKQTIPVDAHQGLSTQIPVEEQWDINRSWNWDDEAASSLIPIGLRKPPPSPRYRKITTIVADNAIARMLQRMKVAQAQAQADYEAQKLSPDEILRLKYGGFKGEPIKETVKAEPSTTKRKLPSKKANPQWPGVSGTQSWGSLLDTPPAPAHQPYYQSQVMPVPFANVQHVGAGNYAGPTYYNCPVPFANGQRIGAGTYAGPTYYNPPVPSANVQQVRAGTYAGPTYYNPPVPSANVQQVGAANYAGTTYYNCPPYPPMFFPSMVHPENGMYMQGRANYNGAPGYQYPVGPPPPPPPPPPPSSPSGEFFWRQKYDPPSQF